jgi:hypothetical protein
MASLAFTTLLAILLAPTLLIRFRKRWVAAFNLAVTNRITSRFADRLPGFGILTNVGRKSGKVLPDASRCFPSARVISCRTDLRAGKRVGQECPSG